MAASFPTHIAEICTWAEKTFTDTMLVSSRAKSEMQKYNGALDFASDYSTMHDGVKYTLDMHLKYGNRTANLIRFYFCWSDKLQRIVIGSMPEHLPTVSNTT